MVMTTTRQEIRDVLMDPRGAGVKESYFTIFEEKNSFIPEEDHSVVVVSPGKNGVEFNKTDGYFNQYQEVLLLQCLYGQGIIVMQRGDGEDNAKEFKVMTLHPGKQVAVPVGFGHSLVNIGKTFLVVLNNIGRTTKDSSKNQQAVSFKAKRGFAYYIVEKKGEVGFEQNPNYTIHPQISTE